MPKARLVKQEAPVVKLPSLKDNFGLTKDEFLRYLENLKEGDDSFILDILSKQLPDSMAYLQSRFKISHEHSYDICLDTFLTFRLKLINSKIKYGNLRFLFTRMCVNQFIDSTKTKNKVNESIKEFLRSLNHKPQNENQFFVILDNYISQMSEQQQVLLKEFYYSDKNMHLIAEEQGITYAALRKKKERLLKKMKSFFLESNQNHYS